MKLNKDVSLVKHIKDYCEKIIETQSRINNDFAALEKDYVFQTSIVFSLTQIGELVNVLSDEFKSNNSQIPWNQIKSLRNKIVHHYGNIDFSYIWKLINTDLLELLKFCENYLKNICLGIEKQKYF